MDIDGTLLDSTTQLPAENLSAIAEAAERGIEILLVTGRRFDFARAVSDLLPCDLHLIVNNGALIKSKTGETHQRRLLASAVARKVVEAMPQFRAEAAVVFDRPGEKQVFLERIDWDDPQRGRYFRRNRQHIGEIRAAYRLLQRRRPYSGGIRREVRADSGREKRLATRFPSPLTSPCR